MSRSHSIDMSAMKSTFILLLTVLCLILATHRVQAHGSVTADGDLCVIRIGFYTAHFKIYQPVRSAHRDYCEDLPATGESIFVMEYLHQALGEVPVQFRIIRDATGLGRFARQSDVEALGDLTPHTVFLQPPTIEPLVYTVLHDFTETGDYLGIVTARHPDTDQVYSAVFPFRVGGRQWGLLPFFLLLALVAHGGYWMSSGGYRRWHARRIHRSTGRQRLAALGLPLLLLLAPAEPAAEDAPWISRNGMFRVSYASEEEPLPLNRIHAWLLRVETADGIPVEEATLTIEGGMPAHNHGLPTRPEVTPHPPAGSYRVEGLRFHMQGDWELRIGIEYAGQRDAVVIPLHL